MYDTGGYVSLRCSEICFLSDTNWTVDGRDGSVYSAIQANLLPLNTSGIVFLTIHADMFRII